MITQITTKTVYQNKWMTVREDKTQLPDGSPGLYGVIDKPDFAAIIPVHADGSIQLVNQYRYPVTQRMWEIPQGSWPKDTDAPATDLARAELAEETGLRAATLTHLGFFHANPGMCSQGYDLFMATDLSQGDTALETTEQDMTTAHFTLPQILDMTATGQMTCAVSIAAIGLIHLRGLRPK